MRIRKPPILPILCLAVASVLGVLLAACARIPVPAAAVGKNNALVFVNTGAGTTNTIPNAYGASPASISAPISLGDAQVNLINAVAAANPNTIVVLNNDNPVLTPWIGNVKALLDMWFAGQEGGTATARVLLGLANPGGHTALTWPKNATDTIWGYNETVPLYPCEPAGPLAAYPNVYLERLNFNYAPGPYPPCVNTVLPGTNGQICTNEIEGIFTGYRYFDKQGIEPQFAFATVCRTRPLSIRT